MTWKPQNTKWQDPSVSLAIKARAPTPWGGGEGGSQRLTPLEINKQYHFSTNGLSSTWNLCRKEWGCPLKEKKFSRSKASLINVSFKLKGSQKGGHGTNVGNKSLPLLSEGQSLNGRGSVFTRLISCGMDLEKRFPLGLSANLRLAFCFLKMTLGWLLQCRTGCRNKPHACFLFPDLTQHILSLFLGVAVRHHLQNDKSWQTVAKDVWRTRERTSPQGQEKWGPSKGTQLNSGAL